MKREGNIIPDFRDTSVHPSSNLEWWYCYGFLMGSSGTRYAWIASFFWVGELSRLKGHYLIYSLIRLLRYYSVTRNEVSRELHSAGMPELFGPLHAIWEGAYAVTGESRSPQGSRTAVRGKGFMELVGYAGRRNV